MMQGMSVSRGVDAGQFGRITYPRVSSVLMTFSDSGPADGLNV